MSGRMEKIIVGGAVGGVLDFQVPVAILQNIPNSSIQKNVHLNVKLKILW